MPSGATCCLDCGHYRIPTVKGEKQLEKAMSDHVAMHARRILRSVALSAPTMKAWLGQPELMLGVMQEPE